MKHGIGYSICIAAFIASPATAQETGRKAFDAWLQSDARLGISATYDSADETGDTLTVRGLRYTYSKTFEFGDDKGADDGTDADKNRISVDVTFTAPELVTDSLTSDHAGFSAKTMTLSDGTRFSARIRDEDDDKGLALAGTVDGYALTNASWPKWPEIEEDPNRPVGRWLPLLHAINDFAVEEQRIGRIEVSIDEIDRPDDESFFGYDMRDIVAKNLRNGFMEEYSAGAFTQTMSGLEGEGGLDSMTIRIASIRAEDYDIGAILRFLEGGGSADGDFETYLGSATALGYRIESDVLNVNLDRVSYEDIDLRPPQANLIDLIDNAIVTGDFAEDRLAAVIFDFYRSFAIGRVSVDGVSFDFRNPDDPEMTGTMKLAQMLLDDLSPDGLGEFSLSSLDVDIEPEGQVSFGRFAIEDIEFAPYGPMKSFIEAQMRSKSEPDPLEAARTFMPLSIAVSMEDFFASIADQGEASLGGFLLAMRSAVPPIPTEVVLSVDDMEMPVEALDDREAEEIFKAAGITSLRVSEALEIRWDEETEDLLIDNIVVEVGDIGAVRARARLGGLPKSVLQNPQRAQAAIATLNLKSLELELVNEGGVEKALALASAQAGLSESQMSDVLLGQLDGMLAIIGNEAFTQQVSQAAESFFADPRNLYLEIRPENPVPVVQILGNAQIAPQTLPDLLGAQVEANR